MSLQSLPKEQSVLAPAYLQTFMILLHYRNWSSTYCGAWEAKCVSAYVQAM